MGKTNIEYADEVSNPLYARLKGDENSKIGTFCEKPDKDGTCTNCWAEVLNLRFGNKLTFDKSNRDKIEWKFRQKELNRMAKLNASKPMSGKFAGRPLVVFCFDTFDIFQPSITDEMRDIVFELYDRLTNLILLVQTTYPAKMSHYFTERYGAEGLPRHYWIGISAGTQEFFDNNKGYLKRIKASEKYVIFEPLLEDIYIDSAQMLYDANVNKKPQFTFAIVGGESNGARPFFIEHGRGIIRQCKAAGVKVFFKQAGSCVYTRNDNGFEGDTLQSFPMDTKTEDWLDDPTKHYQGAMIRVYLKNKKGSDLSELPKDLRVREMPII